MDEESPIINQYNAMWWYWYDDNENYPKISTQILSWCRWRYLLTKNICLDWRICLIEELVFLIFQSEFWIYWKKNSCPVDKIDNATILLKQTAQPVKAYVSYLTLAVRIFYLNWDFLDSIYNCKMTDEVTIDVHHKTGGQSGSQQRLTTVKERTA